MTDSDIYCYAFVEDGPSREVLIKIVDYVNQVRKSQLRFYPGFPSIMFGFGNLKNKCAALLEMSRSGLFSLSLTDLDQEKCPVALLRKWFHYDSCDPFILPREVIFRIAVHEVESWIMDDINEWSKYIGIPEKNFSEAPDEIIDPKKYIFGILSKKGRKKFHREMLPREVSGIGPRYNEIMCEFIKDHWSPVRASNLSPSLKRTICALKSL